VDQSVSPQRRIPAIDLLLRSSAGVALIDSVGRTLATEAYRVSCTELRSQMDGATARSNAIDRDTISLRLHARAHAWSEALLSPSLKPVYNLTGTILHTNLGRAVLPEESIQAMNAVARGASNLEYCLDKGARGERDNHVAAWLCRLTGAEAATVVNNNAAAVLLMLNTFASGRSVAISRGELVEIGGSFRVPDIMQRAGCKLAEVGTTNRTHLADYEEAIANGAQCVMRVQPSNFRIEGFSARVDDSALAALARASGVRFINDLGSGALVDLSRFGLPTEATPAQAIAAGAHVVSFSGDKLLGGPQCGLIVGDADSIDRIRQNPMKRALRCDKMTLAALEAILRLYADPERLLRSVPTLRLLTRTQAEIEQIASLILPALQRAVDGKATVTVEVCSSQIGSGSLPGESLPGRAFVLRPPSSSGHALQKLVRSFRRMTVPVIGRVSDGALWFDLRCVEEAGPFIDNLESLSLS